MTSPTLLAHVVAQFAPRQWENVATEALSFLLQRPNADTAVATLLTPLGLALPDGLRWRTQAASAEDSSIPDLVGDDGRGRHVVVVEAKFWAGLTGNQPLGYLERQDSQFTGDPTVSPILLFLVPDRRVDLITAELERRLGLPRDTAGTTPVFVRDGKVRVAVVSWARMLSALEVELRAAGDEAGVRDLDQLRGLCDRADREAMLPLSPEEIGADRGRRYYEFCSVVDRVTDRLVGEGLLHTRRMQSSAGKGWYGRWVATELGNRQLRIQVSARHWARVYPTPFWVRVESQTEDEELGLRSLVDQGVIQHLDVNSRRAYAGIAAPVGVESEVIVESVAQAVRRLCAAMASDAGGAADEPPTDLDDD